MGKILNPKMPSRFVSNNPVKSPKDSDYNDEKKSSQVSECLDWLWNISFLVFFRNHLMPLQSILERIAFTSRVQFYTKWLILPSIAGLCCLFCKFSQVRSITLYYRFILFSWLFGQRFFSYFGEEGNMNWHIDGVLFHEDEEVPRPEFYGELRRSEIHGNGNATQMEAF